MEKYDHKGNIVHIGSFEFRLVIEGFGDCMIQSSSVSFSAMDADMENNLSAPSRCSHYIFGVHHNRNWIIPKKILLREVGNVRCRHRGHNSPTYGTSLANADKPAISTISISDVSHEILDIWFQNNELKIEIKILDTKEGKILQEAIDAKLGVRFGLVGMGSVFRNEVQGDYHIIQFAWEIINPPMKLNKILQGMFDHGNFNIGRKVRSNKFMDMKYALPEGEHVIKSCYGPVSDLITYYFETPYSAVARWFEEENGIEWVE